MVFVVAENYAQAKFWALARGVRSGRWKYVIGLETLLGVRSPEVILTGRFRRRRDWPAIEEMLVVRDAVTREDLVG